MNRERIYFFLIILVNISILSCSEESGIDAALKNLQNVIENQQHSKNALQGFGVKQKNSANFSEIIFYSNHTDTDFKIYASDSININPNNFSEYTLINYTEILTHPIDSHYVYNLEGNTEKWVIVTEETTDNLLVSEPIKINITSSPTNYHNDLSISKRSLGRAKFDWLDKPDDLNKLFLEILENEDGEINSITYTKENTFTYFNLSNVVTNLSPTDPPQLIENNTYKITVMSIDENNWVKSVIEKEFTYQ